MNAKYSLDESVTLENAFESYKCLVYHEFQDESHIFFWGGGGMEFKSATVDVTIKNFQFNFEGIVLSNITSVWQTL